MEAMVTQSAAVLGTGRWSASHEYAGDAGVTSVTAWKVVVRAESQIRSVAHDRNIRR